MTFQTNMYGVIHKKTPREVVLLNSVGGCSWRRCAFCEYCNTYSRTALEAEKLNEGTLCSVQGVYPTLQIICSASFSELPMITWYDILDVCQQRGIKTVVVESHWIFREHHSLIRDFFKASGIDVQIIFGLETFDFQRREVEWFKGYGRVTLEDVKKYADSVNLLIGVRGQTLESIEKDFETAVPNFVRTNVCVFEPNDTPVERDDELVEAFYNSELFAKYKDDPRVEILDGLDRRAPDTLGFVGVGPQYE